MEEGFYEIALAKFLQSFPELGNYIITFQDLTTELSNSEESDVSIGAFIIKAGVEYYYVPIIAKGSNIYPVDSMFSTSKQKFLPLTPKTINEIINSNSFGLGNKDKIPQTVPGNPSVYDLVNPPRTGKFVYASSSRLSEFLSIIPNDIKEYVKSKIVDNKKLYQGFNNLFGLKEVLEPLSTPTLAPIRPLEPTETPTNVSVVTEGNGLSPEEVRQVLSVGYVVRGEHKVNRIAVNAEDFNRIGRMSQAGLLEPNSEYTVVLSDGTTKDGFVPAVAKVMKPSFRILPSYDTGNGGSGINFTLYENGDFSIGDNHVIQGNGRKDNKVVQTLLNYRPPVMLKNLEGRETFALFTPHMELIGVYNSYQPISRNESGVVIKGVTDLQLQTRVNIFGYRNVKHPVQEEDDLYVPYDVLVILLSKDISYDLEVNVNAASKRRSLAELITLGQDLNLGYDGVEFSINGSPIGGEPKIMEILVVKEGIEPQAANNFVKQAMERKKVRIYLSKQADFGSGEIPQYGEQPPQQPQDQLVQGPGVQKTFEPNVEESLGIGDAQTTEATVLAELLQAPDMYGYIEEYTPDIEEALDKLGRILFLLRLNIDKFGEGNNPSEVFSFIAQLRNVYRMLGDSLIKLKQISAMANVDVSSKIK